MDKIFDNMSKRVSEIDFYGYLGSLVMAILIIVIGFYIIKKLMPYHKKFLHKVVKDVTAEKFIANFTNYVLKGIVILLAISKAGVQTSSIVAILGSIGFAIGLAFQGALSNFAGGILILTQRTFSVDDVIEFDSVKGKVHAITILCTTIHTFDNVVITTPNGKLSNANIINYTKLPTRRVDVKVSASYSEPSDKIIEIIKKVVDKNELILKDPEREVVLTGLADSAVDYTIRAWVLTDDYWTVYFDLLEKVKIQFDKENIEIPYKKLDVNIIK